MTIHLSDLSESARTLLREQTIELPSWAFGNSGTRFKVFPSPGTPRNAYEKIDDAAQVHRFTGITPRVSLHIPWDMVDDFSDLAEHARSQGITLGTINSNVFQDDDYKFGSLTNSDEAIRRKAIDAHLRCIDVMNATGSDTLKIWLGDGTNYPGQDSIAARQERLADSLSVIYENLAPHQRLLLEYKFFEPAFYHTDVPDWGTALAHVTALGERAVVCLDTGHHAPGTNIEFIVVQLLRAGRLGAFDFNSRFYADDDLIVGAADPFQLFRIMHEIVSFGALAPTSGVNFMLDQCHNLEEKIPGEIRSATNVQEA
ncbi:TIM barrel protein, partial [Actinomyces sp.]|uniref:TIM barrel protein n=1 Tax=Actinomyces sp. TaxID=29317 RepID=UPI0025BD2CB6